jgi:hypothetical protein
LKKKWVAVAKKVAVDAKEEEEEVYDDDFYSVCCPIISFK